MINRFYLFLILIFISAFKCKQPLNKNSDLVLKSATKMKYYGGVYGSPMVTVYTLKMEVKRDFNITCDSSYAEDKIDELIIQIDSFNTGKQATLKKGQLLTCILSLKTESVQNAGDFQITIPGSLPRKAPIEVPQSVYLKYQGGKSKGLIINDITELKPLMAP
jgi:hypothetical protein